MGYQAPKTTIWRFSSSIDDLDVRCLTREPVVSIQYRRRKDEDRHITMFRQQGRSRRVRYGTGLGVTIGLDIATSLHGENSRHE